MMKASSAIIYILSFVSIECFAQQKEWIKELPFLDKGYSNVQIDQKGNILVGGFWNDRNGGWSNKKTFMRTFDAEGNQLSLDISSPSSSCDGFVQDKFGNLYISGYFGLESLSFWNLTLNGPLGGGNFYLFKKAKDGKTKWGRTVPWVFGKQLDVDESDNIVCLVKIHESCTLDGITLEPGEGLIFFDQSGVCFKYLKMMGAQRFEVDGENNLIIQFGDGFSSSRELKKFTPDGVLVWTNILPGNGVNSIDADSIGNSFVVCSYYGDIQVGAETLSGQGSYMAMIDKNGNFFKTFSSNTLSSVGHSVHWSEAENVLYTTGSLYESSQNHGEKIITGFTVSKLDLEGNILWSHNERIGDDKNINSSLIAGDGKQLAVICSDYFHTFLVKFRETTSDVPELHRPSALIYPNPTKDIFFVELKNLNGNVLFTVTDNVGKIVKQQKVHLESDMQRFVISISDLPPGTYNIEVVSGKNRIAKRIIRIGG